MKFSLLPLFLFLSTFTFAAAVPVKYKDLKARDEYQITDIKRELPSELVELEKKDIAALTLLFKSLNNSATISLAQTALQLYVTRQQVSVFVGSFIQEKGLEAILQSADQSGLALDLVLMILTHYETVQGLVDVIKYDKTNGNSSSSSSGSSCSSSSSGGLLGGLLNGIGSIFGLGSGSSSGSCTSTTASAMSSSGNGTSTTTSPSSTASSSSSNSGGILGSILGGVGSIFGLGSTGSTGTSSTPTSGASATAATSAAATSTGSSSSSNSGGILGSILGGVGSIFGLNTSNSGSTGSTAATTATTATTAATAAANTAAGVANTVATGAAANTVATGAAANTVATGAAANTVATGTTATTTKATATGTKAGTSTATSGNLVSDITNGIGGLISSILKREDLAELAESEGLIAVMKREDVDEQELMYQLLKRAVDDDLSVVEKRDAMSAIYSQIIAIIGTNSNIESIFESLAKSGLAINVVHSALVQTGFYAFDVQLYHYLVDNGYINLSNVVSAALSSGLVSDIVSDFIGNSSYLKILLNFVLAIFSGGVNVIGLITAIF